MLVRPVVSLVAAALIAATSTAPASARLMTRAEFMPICSQQVHGPSPAQIEAGCNCSYDQGLMWVPLDDVRDLIHEGYRQDGGLAVQTANVPEAKRGLVMAAIKGVQDQMLLCLASAMNNKLNPDGTAKK